jgi:hypothetical protein
MSPRRDIYVHEDDTPLWDRAEQLGGDESLASFLAGALRSYIREQADNPELPTPPGVGEPNIFPDKPLGEHGDNPELATPPGVGEPNIFPDKPLGEHRDNPELATPPGVGEPNIFPDKPL